jgi:hypothetical protein
MRVDATDGPATGQPRRTFPAPALLAAVLLVTAFAWLAPARGQEARIEWRTEYDQAVAEARASGRSVLICWRIPT